MEEKRASSRCGGVLPFLLGFLASVVVLWVVFPQLLFSEKEQPVQFSHKLHVEDQGMECDSCHVYRDDGSYAGMPSNEQCTDCHEEVMGEDPAEEKFVTEYVQQEKEVPWLNYQYQPDNVYFSHMAHDGMDCTECHPDVANAEKAPLYYENRITGYSKQTMKMWQCERCHAESGVSNACYVCHK